MGRLLLLRLSMACEVMVAKKSQFHTTYRCHATIISQGKKDVYKE
jgi:hypothetical protein